jgi:Outer membrane lipoprotein-sorting protein
VRGALPRRCALAFIALLVARGGAPALAAEALTARAIMERVDARDDGDHSSQDLEMVLIDKRGTQRIRKLRAYGRDVGVDEQSILFFVSPADVEDTGFLTYDYKDPARDDDQWLYLPALSRTKRIATADKSGSFMGSDFSYADMTKRPLGHYRYTLMKELEIDGQPVWQIESVPTTEQERDETGYEKSISFVRQDNFVVVRSVHWVKKGSRLKYFDVKKLEQIDGIWVATEMQMSTRKGDETLHRTLLSATNVHFGQKQRDDFFSVRQLEKGP